jgi:hypothetical protein
MRRSGARAMPGDYKKMVQLITISIKPPRDVAAGLENGQKKPLLFGGA